MKFNLIGRMRAFVWNFEGSERVPKLPNGVPKSYEDLQSLLRAYLHGKKEVSYDISACFVFENIRQSTLREI
jgi:hypothetical protein